KRRKIIDEFTDSKKAVICSSRVLNEGVNIPIIDAVAFIDARQSSIDIIQCIGRCLRLHKSKDISSIIIPCLDLDNFDAIITIAKALKNTDIHILENLHAKIINKRSNFIRYNNYNNQTNYISEKINIDINEWKEKIQHQVISIIDSFNYKIQQIK